MGWITIGSDGLNPWAAASSPQIVVAQRSRDVASLWQPGSSPAWREIGPATGAYLPGNPIYHAASEGVFEFGLRGWEQIGYSAQRLYPGRRAPAPRGPNRAWYDSVYVTDIGSGDIWRYDGEPFRWTRIGGAGREFVCVGADLFGLAVDLSGIWRFTGVPNVWEQVGGPASMIFGGSMLWALSPSGHAAYTYVGPGRWLEPALASGDRLPIGPLGRFFSSAAGNVYYLAADHHVWGNRIPRGARPQFNYVSRWTYLGGAFDDVAVRGSSSSSSDELVAVAGDGTIQIYAWESATILTQVLPEASVGRTYHTVLQAAGESPFLWSVASGSLPPGLALNHRGGVGRIEGVPTQSGRFGLTLSLIDGTGATADRMVWLNVHQGDIGAPLAQPRARFDFVLNGNWSSYLTPAPGDVRVAVAPPGTSIDSPLTYTMSSGANGWQVGVPAAAGPGGQWRYYCWIGGTDADGAAAEISSPVFSWNWDAGNPADYLRCDTTDGNFDEGSWSHHPIG
jgi:hypothetical protein